jgi:hypothetical protein
VRDGSAYTWMLFLFFGWSIAAGVASVLVTQLGFPYTWATPITLVMLGAVLFLVYRGYSLHGWLLAGCIGFILISGVAVARAFTVPDPNIPDVYRAEFDANPGSSDSFWGLDQYGGYTVDYRIEYEADRDAYLIGGGYGYPTPVTVEFPPVESAGGQWAFVAGSLRLRGPVSGTFDADLANNPINIDTITFEPDEQLLRAYPEMVVLVPLPERGGRDPILATATLEFEYALADGSSQTETLTRDFAMDVIGLNYLVYYDRYQNWERSRSVIETPLGMALAVGSVLAAGAGVYLWREGDLSTGTSSGLRMVIRRLSGAQQLGAEVHDLAKFRDRTDAEQGVFVGRVIAQSPAGRGGLRTGDVLFELAGKPTNSPGAVNRIAKGIKKGETVDAAVLRHDARVELRIRF